MNTAKMNEIHDVAQAVPYRPAVSIIFPIDIRVSLKKELIHSLKSISGKVERELLATYPADVTSNVMEKIKNTINTVPFDKGRKSIAIFVSPVYEKVIYLDIPLEEKIMIDESFAIRDLVYAQTLAINYLLLVLSGNESRLFLGNNTSLLKVDAGLPVSAESFENDIAERVANFSDMSDRKEIVMEKYLHHIDLALGSIWQTYQLPVFVIGTNRITGHFKQLTKHASAIRNYIHGNFDGSSTEALIKALTPSIQIWQQDKQNDMLHKVQEAADKKKLAEGIHDVWRESINNNGRLLVVEKDYSYVGYHGANETVIGNAAELSGEAGTIKDAVDIIIERVLQFGGEVAFVQNDSLKTYRHIALIKFY